MKGTHSVRGGLDMRLTWYTREINTNLFVMTFDRRFTQRAFNLADPLSGNSIASFLLGAPAFGAIDNNFYPTFRWNYYAPWVQDDWKLTDRLTLNLGLRWDFNTPVFEEQNRINYGFDTQSINPVSSRINQQQFPGYQVRGGLGFVDVDGNPRYPYQWDRNNIQPRVGFAYLLGDKTVLRGGYGLYYINVVGISASNGFGVQTPLITSLDGDRTSTFPLANPFSQGIAEAPGSSQGLETFLGRSVGFSNLDFINPYVHQFSIGAQRELPWRTTIEVSYVGSRTRQEQNRWGGFNEPPVSLRDRCDPTKGGSVAFCNELLPNPFFQVPGFEGTARFTSPTLSRYELSRPFPQFGQITMFDRNDGRIWYNSAQLVVEQARVERHQPQRHVYLVEDDRRERRRQSDRRNGTTKPLITDVDRFVQRSPYESDRRHRVTISGVYRLPFGRDGGRRLGALERAGRRLGGRRHVAVQQRPPVGPPAECVLRQGRDDSERGLRCSRDPRRAELRRPDERRRRRHHARLLGGRRVHGAELHHPAELHPRRHEFPRRSRSGGRRSTSST